MKNINVKYSSKGRYSSVGNGFKYSILSNSKFSNIRFFQIVNF